MKVQVSPLLSALEKERQEVREEIHSLKENLTLATHKESVLSEVIQVGYKVADPV